MSTVLSQIPVIDFSQFSSDDIDERRAVADRVCQACHNIGFAYLSNLGIPQNLTDRTFLESKKLFELPLKRKESLEALSVVSSELRGGYVPLEGEAVSSGVGDLKESFSVFRQGNYMEGLFHRNVEASLAASWLQEYANFCETVQEFYSLCDRAALKLLQAFAISLDLPELFFANKHGQNHVLGLHYYPVTDLLKPGQNRCTEHSDYSSITMLFQDGVEGLEVCTSQGDWIAAPHIAGTVLVNIGDMMQLWTNGVLRSTPHRVVMPQDATRRKSRYSIGFFCDPNSDAEIACIPSCLKDEQALPYPPIVAGDYILKSMRAVYGSRKHAI